MLEAFRPIVSTVGRHSNFARTLLYQQLLKTITLHQVADRSNRFKPRKIKRRHKHYAPLAVPRDEAKRQILKRLTKNKATFVDVTSISMVSWGNCYQARSAHLTLS